VQVFSTAKSPKFQSDYFDKQLIDTGKESIIIAEDYALDFCVSKEKGGEGKRYSRGTVR